MKKRKKFPSVEKYEKNNPTIKFRMKKEEKEAIKIMASDSGKSVSNLVRMALLGLTKDYKENYLQGYNYEEKNGKRMGKDEGLAEGKKKWAIWVYCHWCKKPIDIVPNSDNHTKIIQIMKDMISHYPQQCPP